MFLIFQLFAYYYKVGWTAVSELIIMFGIFAMFGVFFLFFSAFFITHCRLKNMASSRSKCKHGLLDDNVEKGVKKMKSVKFYVNKHLLLL